MVLIEVILCYNSAKYEANFIIPKIPDHKSEKITKTGARLTKLSPKQFSLSV